MYKPHNHGTEIGSTPWLPTSILKGGNALDYTIVVKTTVMSD